MSMERSHFYSPQAGRRIEAPRHVEARFAIGDVVRHKLFDFRGVVFDIDPVFANSEEWYEAIPRELRPRRDQPFYHLLAESEDSSYVAYVSQQNLLDDAVGGPIDHPNVAQLFENFAGGRYRLREMGLEIPNGQVFGELGLISPSNRRTQTVECTEDGEVLTATYMKVRELYFQNPQFGFYFLRLTSERPTRLS